MLLVDSPPAGSTADCMMSFRNGLNEKEELHARHQSPGLPRGEET